MKKNCVLLFLVLLVLMINYRVNAQEQGLPTVTTTAVTKSGNDVVSGGNVVNDGGSTVTARGICYGSNPSPDLSASFTHTEDGTGTGVFTSVIDASATGTIYIRAYATNANGTAYGEELSVNIDYCRLPRFEYNGLTYVVAPDPQSTSSTEYISYSAAYNYCANLTAYGYSDWDMPDIYELETMWQNRTTIGGFIQGTTSNPMCYHSSTYYGSTGHYKLVWLTGGRVQNANLENIGMTTATSGGVTATFRCHVRPIRKEIFLPSVTTNDVTNITYTSATFGGIVTDDGGATVTERGICWGSSPNPTINDLHSNSGTGTGNYTITYVSLTPGTQYYVRAYAINSVGISYGNEVSFTTLPISIPTVTTKSVYNIATTTAISGGGVTDNGGLSLTEKGICWSTSPNPTTYNSHAISNHYNDSDYTVNMTGLIPGTQYYVRAYASNSEGTGYGNEVTFTTTSPPTVTTNNVTDITPNSAVCGGNVTAEGSGSVTARGVCWSTSPSPTTSNSHTNNGTGTGSFTSNITGLNQNTLYYVRAYATNSEGTAYGEEVSFTTTKWLDVTTNNVTYITQTSATCGGYAIAYNGATVTDRGVCWSTTSQTPTVSDNHTSSGTGSGSFTSNLTGLTQNTTYYVRAYATCSGGTVYGETKQFTTTKFEYRISEGGVVATSAGGYFYDSGGPDGYFYSNEQYIMTFMSNQGAGTKIQMMFIEFSLYNYWDASLMIYDGVNTSAPLIGTYRSYESPGTITATNSDGALTFVFISNDGYGWGWKAAISIVTPDYLIDVSANPSNGGTVSGGGYFDYGENCTLTATPAAGYTFVNWTENGNVVSSNANYSFTVNSSRNLVANFAEEGSNCFLVFDLMDSYGDGWNGAKLNVSFSDGSPSQSLTFTSGYNASYVIAANDGANVTLSWTQGSYDSECSFKVKYEDGPQIYQYSYPNSNFTYTFQMDCSSSNNPITFADATVKALCVANWDTNGDGELSYAEAAAVTNLGEVFKNNSSINYFNELQYFVGLSSIGSNAFYGCGGLASVSIPNSVTSIGSNAFKGCVSMTSITLTNTLTSIGNNAFFGCTGLTSIVIPSSVTSIGSEVFRDCPGLAQMSVRSGNPVYDSRNYCKAIIKTATNELVYGCKNTVIPNSVTSIGGAFDGCTSLTSIEIPSSVASIGDYAFYNCTSLTTMTVLADTPPTLGSAVFSNVNKSILVYVPCGSLSAYQSAASWSEFTNYQGIDCPIAQYYPDANNPYSQFVKVYWDNELPSSGYLYFDSFETGDFSKFDWQLDPTYPWSITTTNPYEGGYCMKSGGAGVANVVSDMTVTVNIPADGIMSFFGKISCENYWDYGFFYIDGVEKGSYTGGGGWVENGFYITAGLHTFKWSYQKDSNVNSNDDCFYVDCITFYRTPEYFRVYRAQCDGNETTLIGECFVHEYYDSDFHDVLPSGMYKYGVCALDGSTADIAWSNCIEKLPSYQIVATLNPTEGGAVLGAGTYMQGQSCTLKATANTGYTFTNWTENGAVVSTNSNYTFTVNTNRNLVANFSINTYTIEVSPNPANGGTLAGAGTYSYGQTCSLTATASGNYTFSSWTENDEVVSTEATYSFTVSGDRTLVANFDLQGPITNHWTPIQTFENTMDGIGIVLIDGVEQLSASLELGIFCGDECRGAVLPEEEDGHWLYYFSMGGQTGESFTFRLYDHSIHQELELTCTNEVPFVVNAFLGDWDEPYEFLFSSTLSVAVTVNPEGAGIVTGAGEYPYGTMATLSATANTGFSFMDWSINGEVVSTEPTLTLTVESPVIVTANFNYMQEYAFSTGWNWWSTYIELSDIDGLTMLEDGLGESGVMIKTNGSYARKKPDNTWFGSLRSINNETGYKVQTSSACSMAMTGVLANPAEHPITINANGWTWIGYPVQQSQSANAALAGFNPENKDIVKGQNGYARYDANTSTWKPSSFTLMPGKSYLYYSNATESKSLVWVASRSLESLPEQAECNWQADVHAYPDNSTIQAVVLVDGEELKDENYELGAFVDGICRGSVRLLYDEYYERYFAMLTVTGEDDDVIAFDLINTSKGEIITNCETTMRFIRDGIVGDFDNPYEIQFKTQSKNSDLRIYPNPTDRNTPCTFDLPEDEFVEEVTLYNVLGDIVSREMGAQVNCGINGISSSGVFFVKIVCRSGNTYVGRLMVK